MLWCHYCFCDGCVYTLGTHIIYNRQQGAAENSILQQYSTCALISR